MQRLSRATDSSAAACAEEMLEALPPVMRFVRRHMRSHRGRGLSVPQFRALAVLRVTPAANLSAVADFLGASHPTASRIVSGLVAKRLVKRRESAQDRRQLELVLTGRGTTVMETARRATRAQLARELAALGRPDRSAIVRAMRSLQRLFSAAARGARLFRRSRRGS